MKIISPGKVKIESAVIVCFDPMFSKIVRHNLIIVMWKIFFPVYVIVSGRYLYIIHGPYIQIA